MDLNHLSQKLRPNTSKENEDIPDWGGSRASGRGTFQKPHIIQREAMLVSSSKSLYSGFLWLCFKTKNLSLHWFLGESAEVSWRHFRRTYRVLW